MSVDTRPSLICPRDAARGILRRGSAAGVAGSARIVRAVSDGHGVADLQAHRFGRIRTDQYLPIARPVAVDDPMPVERARRVDVDAGQHIRCRVDAYGFIPVGRRVRLRRQCRTAARNKTHQAYQTPQERFFHLLYHKKYPPNSPNTRMPSAINRLVSASLGRSTGRSPQIFPFCPFME